MSPPHSGGRASPASAVVTPSWSISHPGASPAPVCVLACPCARAAPGSCRVYDLPCARFRSRVFVNVRARPVLCFVCLTSAPPVFVRMAVESGGGFPPRRGPGVGKSTQRSPSLLAGASSLPRREWEGGDGGGSGQLLRSVDDVRCGLSSRPILGTMRGEPRAKN